MVTLIAAAMRRIRFVRCALPCAVALLAASGVLLAAPCLDDPPGARPDRRFVANRDGTVTDLTTQLVWKQCAEGLSGVGCAVGEALLFKWKRAIRQSQEAIFAGCSDWRLPDRIELSSLLQPRCYGLDLDAVNFPNTPPERFWSATPSPYYAGSAWMQHFGNSAVSYGAVYDSAYVRLVRDRIVCAPVESASQSAINR